MDLFPCSVTLIRRTASWSPLSRKERQHWASEIVGTGQPLSRNLNPTRPKMAIQPPTGESCRRRFGRVMRHPEPPRPRSELPARRTADTAVSWYGAFGQNGGLMTDLHKGTPPRWRNRVLYSWGRILVHAVTGNGKIIRLISGPFGCKPTPPRTRLRLVAGIRIPISRCP